MKIRDIITEAGVLGAIGKGIGKGVINAIAPNLSKIGSNIPKEAPVGAIYVITTPDGEVVKKFSNGYWYDSNKDVITNKRDLEKLEQLAATQQSTATVEPAEYEPALKWDYKKGILSVDDRDYQKQKDGGWKDLYTDQIVTKSGVPELNNLLNVARGNKPTVGTVSAQKPLLQPSKEFKSRPALKTQEQPAEPTQVEPTASQPKRQRTGGKVAGRVSQTPNAQRKRKARQVAKEPVPSVFKSNRPEQPAVFKSNRPTK